MQGVSGEIANAVPQPGLSKFADAVEYDKDEDPVSMIVNVCLTIGSKVVEWLSKLLHMLHVLKRGLWALVVIGIFVVILIVILIYFRDKYPRIGFITRSINFERFMNDHYAKVRSLMEDVRDNMDADGEWLWSMTWLEFLQLSCSSRGGCDAKLEEVDMNRYKRMLRTNDISCSAMVFKTSRDRLKALVTWLLSQGNNFERRVTLFYKYFRSIKAINKNFDSVFARADLINESTFKRRGGLNQAAVMKYYTTFFKTFQEFRDLVELMSQQFQLLCKIYSAKRYTPALAKFIANVHSLHLMLNQYEKDIVFMYETRKAPLVGLQFNLYRLYYVPSVRDIFVHKIPQKWSALAVVWMHVFEWVVEAWNLIADIIAKLPCLVAFPNDPGACKNLSLGGKRNASSANANISMNDTQDNLNKSMQSKDPEGNPIDPDEDDDFRKEDSSVETFGEEVREGFSMGKAFRALTLIGGFFINIMRVFQRIGKLAKGWGQDPIGAVFWWITFILACIVSVMMLISYTISTVFFVHFILGFFIATIIAIAWPILYTVFQTLWAGIIALAYFPFWIVDIFTGGLIVQIARCENYPDVWRTGSNYVFGNKAERILGVCMYPCVSRFRPDKWTNATCNYQSRHVPDYCPQQYIANAYLDKGNATIMAGPAAYMFDKYKPDLLWAWNPRVLKELKIAAAYRERNQFLATCNTNLRQYDFINKHICGSLDKLDVGGEGNRQKLSELCRQTYCDTKYNKWPLPASVMHKDDTRYNCFCDILKKTSSSKTSGAEIVSEIVSRTAVNALIAVMTFLVVVATMYYALPPPKA